ncbi:hypothetical protein CRV24_009877 [Beauveria bassiana]|nr:hypothetical protein CRV24_009877 [Beauveria bassiana]KAH8708169.1 C6 finger domain transcription factor nscR [Beauveria bassiana]
MPRGESNAHRACERCRRKKRKCNGNDSKPCKACREGGVVCVDVETPRVSKADLRERLAQLQLINSETDTLLDFLSSKETSPADLNSILRRLSDGQPRAEVTSSLAAQRPIIQDECSQQDTSTVTSPSVTEATSTVSPVATVLNSPTTSAGSISNAQSPSVLDGSTSNALSPSVLAGINNTQTSHFRANLEHYRLQLPQLLDLILSRDCLSFCPINRNDFRRDFGTGHGMYCSTALIDSLLALSTLLAMDSASLAARFGARSKLEDDDLGQSFAREAISALYNGTGLPRRIADIQALGILSLYCLGCNKLNDGKGFAADFGAAIIEQWHTEQPIDSKSLYFPDKQVHANICCAAVSSNR